VTGYPVPGVLTGDPAASVLIGHPVVSGLLLFQEPDIIDGAGGASG
jgi:hypothetical protein